MSVTLRRARRDDAEVLGDIGFDAWLASAFAVHDAGRVDRDWLREDFRGFGREFTATILLAEVDGTMVGWGAREHWNQVITDLWISPTAQGQGVGAILLTALTEEVRAAGHSVVELETLASNAGAIRFYERHGFSIAWRQEKFAASLGYAIEKVGMNKSLT